MSRIPNPLVPYQRAPRGIALGLKLVAPFWAAAILGAFMGLGLWTGIDQSAADARVHQERDAPRLIRSASSVQAGSGR